MQGTSLFNPVSVRREEISSQTVNESLWCVDKYVCSDVTCGRNVGSGVASLLTWVQVSLPYSYGERLGGYAAQASGNAETVLPIDLFNKGCDL